MNITILETELLPPIYQMWPERTKYNVTAAIEGLGVVKVPWLVADRAPGSVRDGLADGLDAQIRRALAEAGFEFMIHAEIPKK
jgi:hypothetical protein